MGAGGSVLSEKCFKRASTVGLGMEKNRADYTVDTFIAEGVSGKVYHGRNSTTNTDVALKFFGYSKDQDARYSDIKREIEAMMAVRGVEGLVQYHGHFLDTTKGLVPDKISTQKLPVIIMEYLEGGPLFGRINYRDTISEKFISHIFKKMALAIQSLHKKNFIHRDIKLDNVLFMNKDYDSPIKIVDLGYVVELATPNGVFCDTSLVGTPGYLAPESIIRKEYSKKSDIWQAGCTLYSLLSGLYAFDPHNRKQVTDYGHFPLTGEAWDDISSGAKNLVTKLLKKNPAHRLTIEQILEHPWLVEEAPDKDFNQDYFTRIKHLALRNKMKHFFLESSLVEGHNKRRSSLREVLPIFRHVSDAALVHNQEKKQQPDCSDSVLEIRNNVAAFNSKMKLLKNMVVTSISSNLGDGSKEIDYETFTNMLKECNLQELCSLQIFNIFDIGNTGTINPRDFLLTMVAFRHDKPTNWTDEADRVHMPVESHDANNHKSSLNDDKDGNVATKCNAGNSNEDTEGGVASLQSTCRSDKSKASDDLAGRSNSASPTNVGINDEVTLLFNLFDIKDAGYIEIEELRIAVNFLLYMGSDQPQTLPNVNELFATMDISKNGRIDFPAFKQFYKHLIASHISLNGRTAA